MPYFPSLERITSHIFDPFSDQKDPSKTLSSYARVFTLLAGLAIAAAIAYARRDKLLVRLLSSLGGGTTIFYLTTFYLKKWSENSENHSSVNSKPGPSSTEKRPTPNSTS